MVRSVVYHSNFDCHKFCLVGTYQVDKNPVNNGGSTPLDWAAFNGHSEVCKVLLEIKVDKNPTNNAGRTPLYYASENGHSVICKYIIDKCF